VPAINPPITTATSWAVPVGFMEVVLKTSEAIFAAAIWEAQKALTLWRGSSSSEQQILLARLQAVLNSPDVAQVLETITSKDDETTRSY